jgi:hypothetical protein
MKIETELALVLSLIATTATVPSDEFSQADTCTPDGLDPVTPTQNGCLRFLGAGGPAQRPWGTARP